ncbi:hypothetical protein [Streptomyces sp. NBC_00623]|uniref:TRADD-N-associated membrane domain-containing protein n=1 Tax=Streptomyces sp. NBC_00623 TaxID=2975790 RepID=UPI0030E14805
MSTTTDPDRPDPPSRSWFLRRDFWALTGLVLTVAGVVVTAWDWVSAQWLWLGKWLASGTEGPLAPVITVTVVALATRSVFRRVDSAGAREAATVSQSRERLNRAEGELEEALRNMPAGAHWHRVAAAIGERHATNGRAVPWPDVRTEPPSDADPEGAGDGLSHPQGSLALAELWKTTHARLTLYHDIATGQAKISFRNAQVAMGVGFVLLVVFVLLALNASTTAGAIVAGGLGAVSAALSGFVAKTFIRSQEAAATHLRSYFDQPLELSRYLAAERLIVDGGLTQEQRGEVLSALVQAMVATPAPPPTPMVVATVPSQSGA